MVIVLTRNSKIGLNMAIRLSYALVVLGFAILPGWYLNEEVAAKMGNWLRTTVKEWNEGNHQQHHILSEDALQSLKALYENPGVQTIEYIESRFLEPNDKDLALLGLRRTVRGAQEGGIAPTWNDVQEEIAQLTETYRQTHVVKAVCMVRHAEGIHNSAEQRLGKEQWESVEAKKDEYFDAELNERGIEQCQDLATAMHEAKQSGFKTDVIITSPLTRALQSIKYGLPQLWGKVPIYAVEMCRERLGKNTCDKRKTLSQLKSEFPEVNFDYFMAEEEDTWWTPVRETDEQVDRRVEHFFNFLMKTPEQWKNVLIMGHSSYMARTIEWVGGPPHWPANGELVPIILRATPSA